MIEKLTDSAVATLFDLPDHLQKTSQPRATATSKRASEPLSVQISSMLNADHLELFFNAVRRFGDWNNNPSVNHFKAAFRALISRVAQENVELVRASLQSPSYASPFHEEDVALDVIENNLSEHFSSESYAILAQNIVTYICSWVVKKILKSTKCDECRFVLCRATAPEPGWSMDHRFCFLHLKNRSELDNLPLLKVQLLVLSRLGNLNVFDSIDFEDHVANTTVDLDNRYFCFININRSPPTAMINATLKLHNVLPVWSFKAERDRSSSSVDQWCGLWIDDYTAASKLPPPQSRDYLSTWLGQTRGLSPCSMASQSASLASLSSLPDDFDEK
ncbi:hypothetical protein CAPTEDRAFT_206541 [Capitella teleta]|uniref:Transposable element P transposase-like RNase H C-terminal domain-containing protein n=1 Tax=Capitella teleta TaxID=283909 RepID=R7TCK2_CAPTE|nr:hypothetical protein CAPTEDRAFT_206541 [Capitella teleta]|eukprot:ELT88791.1 hypothetical protein CAPTEDRAFT_206541 [Capitella teleta]